MKLLSTFLFSLLLTSSVWADRLQYFYGVGAANPTSKLITVPSGQSLFGTDTGTGLGFNVTLGTHLSIVSGALVLTVNKTDVGLGNVDNTSDLNKPVSTATQSALDGKVALSGSYTDPAWLTLSWTGGRITGAPTDLSQFTNSPGFLVPSSITGKADKVVTLSAGTGLTGGGDLSTNRSFALSTGTLASLALADSAVQPATLSGYATSSALTSLTTRVTTVEDTIASAQGGSTAQYMRGNGTFGTFMSDVDSAASASGFLKNITGLVTAGSNITLTGSGTTASPYQLAAPTNAITLTTIGTNGAATWNSGTRTLNIPNYSTIPLSLTTTGTSGVATYNSGTGALNIPNYTPTPRVFNKPTRTLNTAFQISTTQDAVVSYTVDISATISLVSGQTGTVILEYADNSGMTTNVVTVQSTVNGNTGTLTVGLNLTQTTSGSLSGVIPAGKFVRLRTVNTAGTPTFVLRESQEVLLQQISSL